jgi:hypothetical protein
MIDALVGEYESSRVRREGETLHFDFPDSLATLGYKALISPISPGVEQLPSCDEE